MNRRRAHTPALGLVERFERATEATDCDSSRAVLALVRASCEVQGLPSTVCDPGALRRIAGLVQSQPADIAALRPSSGGMGAQR